MGSCWRSNCSIGEKMPDFTITVSSVDAKIIKFLADRTGTTGKILVEENIALWASGQIRGFFIQKFKSKTTAELIAIFGDIIDDD